MHRDLRTFPERLDPPPRVLCGAHGCGQRTNDRKPYCARHVHLNPYASELYVRLELQALRDRQVAGGDSPDLFGSTANEIKTHLRDRGESSAAGIASRLNLPRAVVDAYVRALQDAGVLCARATKKTIIYSFSVEEEHRRESA